MNKDYTKAPMTISSIITIITWIASIVSWFLHGEMPLELLKYVNIVYCTFFACYCCKTGYETYCKQKTEQCKIKQQFKTEQSKIKQQRKIKQGGE